MVMPQAGLYVGLVCDAVMKLRRPVVSVLQVGVQVVVSYLREARDFWLQSAPPSRQLSAT